MTLLYAQKELQIGDRVVINCGKDKGKIGIVVEKPYDTGRYIKLKSEIGKPFECGSRVKDNGLYRYITYTSIQMA